MDSSIIVRPNLSGNIVEEVRKMIFLQELVLNTKIIERDLSEKFGTSRTPIREALKILEQEGLVVNEPRKGYYVKNITCTDIKEIYSLRANLEVFALEYLLAGDREIIKTALTPKLNDIKKVIDVGGGYQELSSLADMDFHKELVHLSGHSRLIHTWNHLYRQYQMVASVLSTYHNSLQKFEIHFLSHEKLTEAFLKEDVLTCQKKLKEHILAAGERLLSKTKPEMES